jgi:hypothetical protein
MIQHRSLQEVYTAARTDRRYRAEPAWLAQVWLGKLMTLFRRGVTDWHLTTDVESNELWRFFRETGLPCSCRRKSNADSTEHAEQRSQTLASPSCPFNEEEQQASKICEIRAVLLNKAVTMRERIGFMKNRPCTHREYLMLDTIASVLWFRVDPKYKGAKLGVWTMYIWMTVHASLKAECLPLIRGTLSFVNRWNKVQERLLPRSLLCLPDVCRIASQGFTNNPGIERTMSISGGNSK